MQDESSSAWSWNYGLVSFTADRLELYNVTERDNLVVQCNASNVHGYALSTASLTVYRKSLQS